MTSLVPLSRGLLSLTPVADVLATSGDVFPSGDTTGAADVAAINVALLSRSVRLCGDYYINSAITIPSNRTLLLNDASITRASGATYGNMITNSNLSAGNTNVRVIGIGRALLNGNGGASWTAHFDYRWNLLLFSNVTGYEIGGLQFQNPPDWNISPQNCSGGWIHDLKLINGSNAMQLLGGNRDTIIENLTGYTQDDVIAIESCTAASNDSGYAYDGVGGGEVVDITIRNIQVSHGADSVRLLNGRGQLMHRIKISGVKQPFNTVHSSSATNGRILFGQSTYESIAPIKTDLCDIEITDSDIFLVISQACSNIRLSGIGNPEFGTGTGETTTAPLVALVSVTGGASTQVLNLKISDVQINAAGSTGSTLIATATGTSINKLLIENVYVLVTDTLLNNSGTVTNLKMRGVYAQRILTSLTGSAIQETGRISDVTVENFSGTAMYSAAMVTSFGENMPTFTSASTAPVATSGSMVRCDATRVLDGGASSPALYFADGTSWNRILTLAH